MSKAKWPLKSDAAGVNPEEVNAAQDEAKRRGVPTEFDRDTGQAVFRSRSHRKEFCKAFHLRDQDAGYGDHAGQ